MLRPPAWVRWLGPPLLIGLWLLMLSPVVLAVRERDWMAAVRDSGLGPLGAVVGWVIVGVLLLVIPPAVRAILTYRTVLDVDGVEPPSVENGLASTTSKKCAGWRRVAP